MRSKQDRSGSLRAVTGGDFSSWDRSLAGAGGCAGRRIRLRFAFVGFAVLLGGPDPGGGSPLGPEIGQNIGWSSYSVPWVNPCGPASVSLFMEARMDRTFAPFQMSIGDRQMQFSYAVRVPMLNRTGGPLDCFPRVMHVEYWLISGLAERNPPLEIPYQITNGLESALFVRPIQMVTIEPVHRPDEPLAAELVFYVPRFIPYDLDVVHQAAAVVYDMYGNIAMILTSHAVKVHVPDSTLRR